MNPQRYEFVSKELNANEKPVNAKFWIGWFERSTVFVKYGRIGTKGTIKKKDLGSEEDANEYLEKKTQEKLKKGYAPV